MARGRRTSKCDPMDEYLSHLGLFRKPTAKDGSCLFRVVSEQVFYCQALHLQVRDACIRYMEKHRERFAPFVEGPFDHHLFALRNPKEWAGQVEISAMSLMYKRDFQVYQEVGKPPDSVTQNGFNEKILLCFSGGNHYDSVYHKTFHDAAAICQSIVYGILYNDVFKMEKEVIEAIDLLRSKSKRKQSESSTDSGEVKHESELETSTESEKGKDIEHKEIEAEQRRLEMIPKKPAFPYKVAKALDPEIYRNVELDIWVDARKEQQRFDYHYAANLQFSPGDKCLVHLDEEESRYFNAHIQEVHSPQGPVTVFIEDLGEKHVLQLKNLKPLMHYGYPASHPWIPVGGGGGGAGGGGGKNFKQLTGYYQKQQPPQQVNSYIPDYDKGKRRPKKGKGIYPGAPVFHGPNAFIPPFQYPAAMAAAIEHQQSMVRNQHQQQQHQQQQQQIPLQHQSPHQQSQQYGERPQRQPHRYSSPSKLAPRFNRLNQENAMTEQGGYNTQGRGKSPHDYPQPQSRQQWADGSPQYRQQWTDRPPPVKGRGRYSGRGSPKSYFGHTPEEREERKAIEESVALYELQERDMNAFPALPTAPTSNAPSTSPASFWGKYKKENRRSPTPPIQIPTSPATSEPRSPFNPVKGSYENELSKQMQEANFTDQGFPIEDGSDISPRKSVTPPTTQFLQRSIDEQSEQMQFSPQQQMLPPQQQQQQMPLQQQPQQPFSSSPTPGGGITQMCASPVPAPPMMVPNNYVPFGMPMYPMMIPFTENLTGPVNFSAGVSRDTYGADLPHSDVNTLRFFYNFGVEYYHRYISLVQMQQQAQQDAMAYNMPVGAGPPPPPQAVMPPQQQQTGNPGLEVHYGGSGGMTSPEDKQYGSDGISSQDETEQEQDDRLTNGQSENIQCLNTPEFVDPSIIQQGPPDRSAPFQSTEVENLSIEELSLELEQCPEVPTMADPVLAQERYSEVEEGSSQMGRKPIYEASPNRSGHRQRKYSGGSGGYKSPPRFRNLRNLQARQNMGENYAAQQGLTSSMHESANPASSTATSSMSHSVQYRGAQNIRMSPDTKNIPPRFLHSSTANVASDSANNPANALQSSPSHTGPSMQPYYADGSTNSQSSAQPIGSYYSPAATTSQTMSTTEHYTLQQPGIPYENPAAAAANASYQFNSQAPPSANPWQQVNTSNAYMYTSNNSKPLPNMYGNTPPYVSSYSPQGGQYVVSAMVSQAGNVQYS